MFVSQVIFSGDVAEKNNLENIMKRKLTETQGEIEGLISSECWKQSKMESLEYSFITKWKSKDAFKKWLNRAEHRVHHQKMAHSKRPTIKKTIHEYEVFTFE